MAQKNSADKDESWIKTGISGFDQLLKKGIPKGYSIIVAGACGTGKTIFLLQTMNYACSRGEKCLYISFEESEERLKEHMRDFGWNPDEYEKRGLLVIKRMKAFDISRYVEALLAKEEGELMIEMEEVSELIPEGFKPDRIFLDSITALAAGFVSKEESYRIYIEQLFRFFERMGATTFSITETDSAPKKLSPTGVEEFLADGVIIMYNLSHNNLRIRVLEIFKLRGTAHKEKLVPFKITSGGIEVYPEQDILEIGSRE
jgi:KaiC/GvpD/RAD55 family RecA-like ATPase